MKIEFKVIHAGSEIAVITSNILPHVGEILIVPLLGDMKVTQVIHDYVKDERRVRVDRL